MSDNPCPKCNGTGWYQRTIFATYSAGFSREDAPCPECCVLVLKSELVHLQGVKDAARAGTPSLPDFLDWLGDRLTNLDNNPNTDFVLACHRHAQELREALAAKFPINVDLPPVNARDKLDAAVDAHDRAESTRADIDHFDHKLEQALGIKLHKESE